jgi:hypothetical protein
MSKVGFVSEVGQKRRSDSAPLSVYLNKKVSELVSSSHSRQKVI